MMPAVFRILAVFAGVACAGALAQESPDALPLDIWHRTAKQIGGCTFSYEVDSRPTDELLNAIRTEPLDPKQRNLIVGIYSRTRVSLNITKKAGDWRYEVKQERSQLDLNGLLKGGSLFGAPEVESDTVEIHGWSGFFYLDRLEKTGCFRNEWPYRPETVFDYVLPPSVGSNGVKRLPGELPTFQLTDKSGKSAKHYQLDPRSGMMPTRIDCYDVLPDGALFLYRFVKVGKYLETKQGSYVPEMGTIYDFASNKEGQIRWEVEKHFKLTASECGQEIPDSVFRLKFPPGTHVTDYTTGLNYVIPKDGTNPEFTVAKEIGKTPAPRK